MISSESCQGLEKKEMLGGKGGCLLPVFTMIQHYTDIIFLFLFGTLFYSKWNTKWPNEALVEMSFEIPKLNGSS